MRIASPDRLRDDQASVAELQGTTAASQPNFSEHPGALLRAGLVSRTMRGTSSGYAIADEGVLELCEQVCGGLRHQVAELDLIPESQEETR